VVAWVIFLASTPLLFFHSRALVSVRAASGSQVDFESQQWLVLETFLCVAGPYVLLSVWYETLFLLAFALLLASWLVLEQRSAAMHQPARGLQLRDAAVALLYLFFAYSAFFGPGNTASISSFEMSSTYRFTTFYSPFLMGAILMMKLAIPFVLVTVTYHLVVGMTSAPP
jgi:GPI ethanolamine phosphate transferase 1